MKISSPIFFALLLALPVSGADLKEAKVTAVINDVNLLPTAAATRRATVNDDVRRGTAVRTGVESRSELTFTDQTIARLGANTIFSFEEGTRNMDLGGGAMLLRVPKNAGGAKITTAAVTAAITGTTVMMQYDPKGYAKFIVLEGTACMSLKANPADCVSVKAGQLLAIRVNPPPSSIPAPIDVDLKKLTETSALLSSDFPPLPSLDLISQAVQAQAPSEDSNSKASDQIVVASLTEMINAVDQRTAVADLTSSTPTPTPTPTITPTPTPTPPTTPTPTPTPPSTPTPTPTPPATPTPTPTPPSTPTPTPTPPATPTPTPTPPPMAQTVTYNSSQNGRWSDANVWTPNVVPNNGNGNLYNASISGGFLVQDISPGVIIEELFMSGGTLRLDNPLTLKAGLSFSGGSINSGILNIAGSSSQSATMSANGLTINNSGTYDLTLNTTNVFSGGGSVFNNSGTLTASSDGGTLNFNIPLNNTGTVSIPASGSATLRLSAGGSSSGVFSPDGGVIELASDFSLTSGASIVGHGVVQVDDAHRLNISGAILLNGGGYLLVHATGNFTDVSLTGDTTLTGNGRIRLENAARLRGTGVLTNGVTIQGETNNSGSLGTNEIGLVNDTAGVIDADVAGLTLNVDPNPSAGLTNRGTMQASNGGFLLLNGNGGGAFDNSNGTIIAQNGSEVRLVNGASITGGTLSTNGTGVIRSLNTASLNSLTNAGSFRVSDSTSVTLSGTINNTGTITVAAAGNFTDLFANSAVTLTGGGMVNLQNAARVRGSGTLTLQNQTVQGETSNSGSFGTNELGLVVGSGGLVDANINGLALNVDPNSSAGLTNAGLMRASNGGVLLLNGNGGGGFQNNAVISALAGSQVQLVNGAIITGGTLTTVGSGIFRTLNTATLVSLTNAGNFIVSDSTSLSLEGSLINTGNLTVAAAGNFTDLFINGSVTLTGSGSLNLQNAARVRGSGTLFNGGPNGEVSTIQGETSNSGSLGANELAIVNRSGGLIDANDSSGQGRALVVDPSPAGNLINTGLMRASNSGILQLTGSGGGIFNNTGGIIQSLSGAQVQLRDGATIVGGMLQTIGSGVVRNVNSATLSGLTNAGNFTANDSTTTIVVGTILNNGRFLLAAQGDFTDLSLSGDVTFTGSGRLDLQNADRVRSAGGTPPRLTNTGGHTIEGETSNSGSLGTNEIAITNQSIINANVTGLFLNLDPANVANAFLNDTTGIAEATNGGLLRLNGTGGGDFINNNVISAIGTGSEVQLLNGANLSGGTLTTSSGGVIRNLNTATLANLTIAGSFIANDATTTTFLGTINNTGSIRIAAAGDFTDLLLNGNLLLTGNGVLTLVNADRVRGSGILDNSSTIAGETSNSGSLGTNEIGIENLANGVIDANVSGRTLNVDPNASNGVINAGLMRATNGGILLLNGTGGGSFALISGGSVIAFDLSEVQLANGAATVGGLWQTQGTGVIRVLNTASLADLSLGANFIANDASTTTFFGTITNTGNITIQSTGDFTDAYLGGVTFTGGGRVFLSNADRLRGSGVFTNVNNIIQGETNNSGSLGTNELGIVNQSSGIIDANVNGLVLNIDPRASDGLTNAGTMRATNGGILLLNGNGGGDFSNSGTIAATTGGTLRFNANVNSSGTVDVGSNTLTATGNYTQSAGTFRLAGGSVQSNNALSFQGGLVDAYGTINSAITNNANLRPALGGTGLHVTGNISLLSASQLTFQLGGLTQGSQYGFLGVIGNVSLGGQLVLSFVNGFQNSVSNSNTFTVLSSTATLSGVFANVASGSRLNTSDASGSFLVSYNGSNVVLSDYVATSFKPAVTQVATSDRITVSPSGALASTMVKTAPRAVLEEEVGRTMSSRPSSPNRATLNVKNSTQLLALLEEASPAADGKVTIKAARARNPVTHGPAAVANVREPTKVDRYASEPGGKAKLPSIALDTFRNARIER